MEGPQEVTVGVKVVWSLQIGVQTPETRVNNRENHGFLHHCRHAHYRHSNGLTDELEDKWFEVVPRRMVEEHALKAATDAAQQSLPGQDRPTRLT